MGQCAIRRVGTPTRQSTVKRVVVILHRDRWLRISFFASSSDREGLHEFLEAVRSYESRDVVSRDLAPFCTGFCFLSSAQLDGKRQRGSIGC